MGDSSYDKIRIDPAIICEVHSDDCISVRVFNRDGTYFLSSVTRVDDLQGSRCWDWMPYQVQKFREETSLADPVTDDSKLD